MLLSISSLLYLTSLYYFLFEINISSLTAFKLSFSCSLLTFILDLDTYSSFFTFWRYFYLCLTYHAADCRTFAWNYSFLSFSMAFFLFFSIQRASLFFRPISDSHRLLTDCPNNNSKLIIFYSVPSGMQATSSTLGGYIIISDSEWGKPSRRVQFGQLEWLTLHQMQSIFLLWNTKKKKKDFWKKMTPTQSRTIVLYANTNYQILYFHINRKTKSYFSFWGKRDFKFLMVSFLSGFSTVAICAGTVTLASGRS